MTTDSNCKISGKLGTRWRSPSRRILRSNVTLRQFPQSYPLLAMIHPRRCKRRTLLVTAWEGDEEVASESIKLQLLHDSK